MTSSHLLRAKPTNFNRSATSDFSVVLKDAETLIFLPGDPVKAQKLQGMSCPLVSLEQPSELQVFIQS